MTPKMTRAALALISVVAASATACARNPVTGARELSLISESREIAMGQDAAKQVESSMGLVDDAELQAYVRRIGQRLAAKSERPKLPWTFAVVDDPTPNAFALPGGPVFITRGLLSLMDTEAELASVLGHEIGHITARHSVSQMSRAQLAQVGLGLGSIFVPQIQSVGGVLSSGMELAFLKYGRDDERQSDDLGFKYALNEGYDIREMDDVFASLSHAGELKHSSPVPSWLSTHPAPEERIKRINEKVATTTLPPNATVNRTEYLGRINRMVYGDNPRQGFFRNGEFLHPDLKFKLQFPSDWKTQNLSQAVVAGSPNQDAVMQLTFAKGTPGEAAQAFFSQQGIQGGQLTRETVNGIPSVSGHFQANTQQGTIAGLAAFLEYGGKTYQLLGYTSSAQMRTYEKVFQNAASSFARLTDASALNVKANRIEVVRLTSAMNLAEFNRRSPSVIPINELALINQVTDVNATLPSGTQVKRVTAS